MKKEMNQQDWTMVAEIELSYKTKIKPSSRPKVTCASDCYKAFLQSWDPNKIEFVEQFKVMLLNRNARVLGIYELSTGTVALCPIDPKQIFCAAIKANASSIVLCHNHPSGSIEPSRADKMVTEKLSAAGKIMELPILEHIIISSEGFYSFAENGLL